MDVSRWAIDLKLAPTDRRWLEDLVRNGNTPQKLVPRAGIALLSDGTRLNGAIAQDVGVLLPTVHCWQRRVQEHRHPEFPEQTVWQVFEAEWPRLVSYAGRLDGFHALPVSVSKTCLVRFDNNKYSLLATAVGRPVEVHAYADRIVIRQDGVAVGEHARRFGRGETVYDP